jgi:hypothetical protein
MNASSAIPSTPKPSLFRDLPIPAARLGAATGVHHIPEDPSAEAGAVVEAFLEDGKIIISNIYQFKTHNND